MQNLPNNRHEARRLGLTRYFTGKPCSHGHITTRYLTGTCVDCQKRAIREYGQRNPEQALARSREWQKVNPERARQRSLKSKRKAMGLPEPTRPMPTHCELCNKHVTIQGKMHLDHSHTTGKFRGWLCNTCNLSLGHLGDNVAGLERAIAYLKLNDV